MFEINIIFECNVKGFMRESRKFVGMAYLKKDSCYPINHIPIAKSLFDFLVKYYKNSSRRKYNFTFEEPHLFGIFDRDSAIKVSRCFLKIESRLFFIEENLETGGGLKTQSNVRTLKIFVRDFYLESKDLDEDDESKLQFFKEKLEELTKIIMDQKLLTKKFKSKK